MLKILGTSALSKYRLNQLLTQLKSLNSTISNLSVRFVHFVETNKEPGEKRSTDAQPLVGIWLCRA